VRRIVGLVLIVILISCAAALRSARASNLSPRGTKYEQHIEQRYNSWWQRMVVWVARDGVVHFREPVHEEITNRIFGCEEDESICGDPDVEFAGPFVLAGVRWNDDPPFRLEAGQGQHTSCKTTETIRFTTQPRCWYELFTEAKHQAASGDVPDAYNHAPMLARSHFGDLQFFHAMASQDGETAGETQKRVMMWAEFTWKVASDEYALNTPLADVSIAGFDDFFGLSGWTVQDLFTVGNPALRPHIEDLAFGSILHTVEDSFAKGHVERGQAPTGTTCAAAPTLAQPARVVEFHSYAHQDGKKHAAYDTRAAFEQGVLADKPNVVLVGTALRELYEREAKWETVRPYFECVFAVVDTNTKATPGHEFEER
jgi:hypothetical protein